MQSPEPGVNGVPHGTLSDTGAICGSDSGVRLVSRASIMRDFRPPGSLEVGHATSSAPPQAGGSTCPSA